MLGNSHGFDPTVRGSTGGEFVCGCVSVREVGVGVLLPYYFMSWVILNHHRLFTADEHVGLRYLDQRTVRSCVTWWP